MEAKSLFDVQRAEGSIFVDNLTICSADRLLSNCYEHLQKEVELERPGVAATLFSHDLLNLSALVESVVCHENIYVNAEYIDRWNSDIEQGTLRPLADVVTPVFWPKDQRKQAEDQLRERINLRHTDLKLSDFVGVVFRDAHSAFRNSTGEIERSLFVPYDEGSRPWGTPFSIAMGTAFYLMSSQVLGVPYKPSVLRANLLSELLGEQILRHWSKGQFKCETRLGSCKPQPLLLAAQAPE